MVVWSSFVVTYTATVSVTVGGRRHLLSASATSELRHAFNGAAREALLKVLNELARLTEKIVAAEIPPPHVARTVQSGPIAGNDAVRAKNAPSAATAHHRRGQQIA